MSLEQITDHAVAALARLPYQMQGRPNMVFLIETLCGPIQDLEDAAYGVLLGFLIDTAVGTQLDTLGDIVAQPRDGVTDDDLYRRYVRAKVAVLNSKGTYPDIIAVIELVLGEATTTITLQNSAAATVLVDLGTTTGTTAAVAEILIGFLRKTVSATVRLLLTYSESDDAETFSTGELVILSGAHSIGATTLTMATAIALPLTGSLVLSPGLAAQETVTYTGVVDTSVTGVSALTNNHLTGAEVLQYDEDTGLGDTADALVGGDFAGVLE